MAKKGKKTSKHIYPLNINGMQGRMYKSPPPKGKKTEILFIYGHHASLERYIGALEYLNRVGGVTCPDLPGFGGMDTFYKIGEKQTLDNMADYLAAFVKLRYHKKQFVLIGYSLGVMVYTRMLQKYPDIAKQVTTVFSGAGFAHKDDFAFSKTRFWFFRSAAWLMSFRLTSAFYKYVALRPIFIRYVYRRLFNAKKKFDNKDSKQIEEAIEMEVDLWRNNDPRTYMATALIMFKLDLTKGPKVDLPIYHASIDDDMYFNHIRVEKHLSEIYSEIHVGKVSVPQHAMSVVATAEEAASFIPKQFISVIKKMS